MKYYAAWEKNGRWRVVMLSYYFSPKPLDNIREFKTFEEANKVARGVAKGIYGYRSGTHVNMR